MTSGKCSSIDYAIEHGEDYQFRWFKTLLVDFQR